MGLAALLLSAFALWYGFHLGSKRGNARIANLNNQIVTLENKIQIDKIEIAKLDLSLKEAIAAIPNKKEAYQSSKEKALAEASQIETAFHQPEIKLAFDDFESALRDSEDVQKALDAALVICQEKGQAQATLIDDQNKTIDKLEEALAESQKKTDDETHKKKLYRGGLILSVVITIISFL